MKLADLADAGEKARGVGFQNVRGAREEDGYLRSSIPPECIESPSVSGARGYQGESAAHDQATKISKNENIFNDPMKILREFNEALAEGSMNLFGEDGVPSDFGYAPALVENQRTRFRFRRD